MMLLSNILPDCRSCCVLSFTQLCPFSSHCSLHPSHSQARQVRCLQWAVSSLTALTVSWKRSRTRGSSLSMRQWRWGVCLYIEAVIYSEASMCACVCVGGRGGEQLSIPLSLCTVPSMAVRRVPNVSSYSLMRRFSPFMLLSCTM